MDLLNDKDSKILHEHFNIRKECEEKHSDHTKEFYDEKYTKDEKEEINKSITKINSLRQEYYCHKYWYIELLIGVVAISMCCCRCNEFIGNKIELLVLIIIGIFACIHSIVRLGVKNKIKSNLKRYGFEHEE